uniref:Uncharacterized protein n=1 Tax=Anopheles melas TaxID=34690 RepID=A0A182UJA0_9DIPT
MNDRTGAVSGAYTAMLPPCGSTVGMKLSSEMLQAADEPPLCECGLSERASDGTGEPAVLLSPDPEPPGHPDSACFVSSGSRENDFVHVGHLKRFTSSCVCWCARRFDRSANAREHSLHTNGFSPVCVRMWPCSSHGRENALSQCVHLHGSVCVRMCILSAPSVLYGLSHSLHTNVFCAWLPSAAGQWNCWCFDRPE